MTSSVYFRVATIEFIDKSIPDTFTPNLTRNLPAAPPPQPISKV